MTGWRFGLLTALAMATGCARPPAPPDAEHFKVSAQVVDSKTGQPVQPPPVRRPVRTVLPEDRQQPVLKRLEPAPPPDEREPRTEQPSTRTPRTPEEETLLAVARDRPFVPVDSRVGGQPVVMSFAGGDDRCRTVAVTYTAQLVAELWRVCADGQVTLDREAEPIPVANDPGLLAARQSAVHMAYANSRALSQFGELTIRAQSSGSPDANGCMAIRSAVSWNGITVGMADETICSAGE
jgi:hypothetical protein